MKTIQGLKKLGILKDHNIPTYLEMEELFEDGENRVGVVQATGTGKSFVAFQFLYDNVFSINKEVYSSKELFKDGKYRAKRAVVLEPRQGIVFRFNELCEKLCRELNVPFDDVIVARYDQLKLLTDEELQLLDFDYIILDEFHRLGAEGRGTVAQKLLQANPNAKVLGLTATPIRYLDKKRDMGDELFGDNIVRGLNVAEAIREGVLPNPEYVMAVRSYEETAKIIEDKINAIRDKKTRELYKKELEELRRHPEFAKGLKETFERKIQKKNGKFIAFCADTEKLQSLRDEIENNGLLSGVNQNVKIYQITYKDKKEDVERTFKAFEEDKSDSFKVLLAVDMFNEGIHISDVVGCFLFRPTISPEIYTQQIGRVLSVRDDKDFRPQIFDIVNNLQSYEKIILAFEAEKGNSSGGSFGGDGEEQSIIPFEITGSDEDLYYRLKNLFDVVSNIQTSEAQWLAAAERYAHEYGDLNIPQDYIDQESELKLGLWIHNIIRNYNDDKNSVRERIVKKLVSLDEKWYTYTRDNQNQTRFIKILDDLRKFTDKHGKVPIPSTFTKGFEEFSFLCNQCTMIKAILKNNEIDDEKVKKYKHYYPKELIEEMLKINPNVFNDRLQFLRNDRDEQIIKELIRFKEIYGCIPVPNVQTQGFEEFEFLEKQCGAIRLSLTDGKIDEEKSKKYITHYSQELIDQMLEINPNALSDRKLHLRSERYDRIIDELKRFVDAYGQIPIPTQMAKGFEEFSFLTKQCCELKRQRRATFSQDLVDEILQINPNAFNDRKEYLRKERDSKILDELKRFVDQYGEIPIPKESKSIKGFEFLMDHCHRIKRVLIDGKTVDQTDSRKYAYSQELVDQMLEINPQALTFSKSKDKELS